MFNTHCTHCGASNQSPPHYKDQSIKCGNCGDKFIAVEDFERPFRFHCSACGESIEAEQGMKGAQATCPHCNQDILVIEDSASESPTRSMDTLDTKPEGISGSDVNVATKNTASTNFSDDKHLQSIKNILIALLLIVVVMLCFIVYNQSQDDSGIERPAQSFDNKSLTPAIAPVINEESRESKAEREKEEENKRLLDEAEDILNERERNIQRIKSLLDNRNELNRAIIDLINAISESGDPNASEKLKEPMIQNGIDSIKKFEDDIQEASMDNYKLKSSWDTKKKYLPTDLRFSDPEFHKCSILTDWRIDRH